MKWTQDKILELNMLKDYKSNIEIAELFGTSQKAIERAINKFNIKRDKETLLKLRRGVAKRIFKNEEKEQNGSLNPNWKGGISKNNYHYKKLQIQRYPEKVKARNEVYRAIKFGKLKRQPCEVCNTLENIQAHHDDYTKPLEVKWFCRKHHKEVHI